MVHIKRKCGCKDREFFEVRNVPSGLYGDPFDASCNMQIEGDTAYISLLSPTFHVNMWRSIRAYCQALDVRTVKYEHNGKPETVTI